jgi:hypothetical protein
MRLILCGATKVLDLGKCRGPASGEYEKAPEVGEKQTLCKQCHHYEVCPTSVCKVVHFLGCGLPNNLKVATSEKRT